MINKSIDGGIFPYCLQMAEVIPVYMKADNLKKENYRPVSILPSAFRTGYSCQDTLLALTEKIKKKAIREHHSAGAILMDFSKAFDCMPN